MRSVLEYIGKIQDGYHEQGGMRIGTTNLSEISDDVEFSLGRDKVIHVSYFICDKLLSKEEFLENHLLTVFGEYKVKSYDVHGLWTGYMWTEEEFEVGGHNLLKEISSQEGKYCYLKIYNDVEKRNVAINDVLDDK